MPKKFKGENTKAVAARERRSAAEEQRKAKKQQEEDDAYWKDDDKDAAKKQKRKEDKEKKRLDLLQKKLESQRLLDEEESSLHSAKPAPSAKVTRAQIEHNKREVQRKQAEAAKQETKAPVHDEVPLEENVNRLVSEEGEARTVEDAIQVLSAKESLEKHPEKRVKAAYASYESERLPRLKQENPNMRLSQLKQILKKDWMKSPDNPLNQRTASYNTKLH